MIYDGSVDMVIFSNRNTMPLDRLKSDQEAVAILIRLSTDIGERAKQIAQGWDIQYVMRCFAAWWVKIGKPETKNADALFLKFMSHMASAERSALGVANCTYGPNGSKVPKRPSDFRYPICIGLRL